jgi:hypothetical protein
MNQDKFARLAWIVNTLLNPADNVDADELSAIEDEFSDSIEHPAGAALIHYPETWGMGESPSADQIVSEALSWTPQVLSMKVQSVRRHFKRPDLFVYEVSTDRIHTQVVSNRQLKEGQLCDVAMSGANLPDGRTASHGFIDNVYSVGEIIEPPG